MSAITYVENAFLLFYDAATNRCSDINPRDFSAIVNFQQLIEDNKPLTENQAKFILRLLEKYRHVWKSSAAGIEFVLMDPKWKQEFRKLDLTKEIFVEVEDNIPWLCLRFPYVLREKFEKEILKDTEYFAHNFGNAQYWDKERKIRKLNLYNYNHLQIQDFVRKNGFTIHESFMEAVNYIEEIWNNENKILKKSKIIDHTVSLINADRDSLDFFEKNKKNPSQDLLMAKSMGYTLENPSENLLEKIAASEENWFWHKDLKNLLDLSSTVGGKSICILDRSSNYKDWLKNFKNFADDYVEYFNVRICFRENSDQDPNFNQWIADNNFGGKASDGNFLIFLHKPNKWLFNDINEVKIVLTNSVYPPTDQITMHFLQSHPCVIFVGDVKPTDPKGRKIVEL